MDPDRHLLSTREKRCLFSCTLEQQLRGSNSTLESWADLAEMCLKDWIKKNMQRGHYDNGWMKAKKKK